MFVHIFLPFLIWYKTVPQSAGRRYYVDYVRPNAEMHMLFMHLAQSVHEQMRQEAEKPLESQGALMDQVKLC